jgi:hypothetical protein
MGLARLAAILALAGTAGLTAAGCSSVIALWPDGEGDCDEAPRGMRGSIDWASAETIEMRISSGEFTPMVLDLFRYRPYRLHVVNRDDTMRALHGSAFFSAVSLIAVQEGLEAVDDDPGCIDWITVPAEGTLELLFVPVRRGRFQLAESYLPLNVWGTGLGVVHIR